MLNSNPAGVFKTNVTPVPALMSFFPAEAEASATLIAPSVVHAGDWALAAESDERFKPPEAEVTVTLAKLPTVPTKRVAKANAERRVAAKLAGTPRRNWRVIFTAKTISSKIFAVAFTRSHKNAAFERITQIQF